MLYLDVSAGIDLVYSVSRSSPRLPVQVITLYKHTVIAEAADPDVALSSQV